MKICFKICYVRLSQTINIDCIDGALQKSEGDIRDCTICNCYSCYNNQNCCKKQSSFILLQEVVFGKHLYYSSKNIFDFMS